MQDITITGSVTITRSKHAASSCLKRTIKLARTKRNRLLQYLVVFPKYWAYQDRVLCLLRPEFRSKIENYYNNDGPRLKKLLSIDAIEELDIECSDMLKGVPDAISGATNLDLLIDFYTVKKYLGRVPTLTEIGRLGKYSQRLWHKKFGAYHKFLVLIGEKAERGGRAASRKSPKQNARVKSNKNEVKSVSNSVLTLKHIYEVKRKELGRAPTIMEIDVWDSCEFNDAVGYFGGWGKFIDKMEDHGGE